MHKLRKTLILILAVGIPAAAAPLLTVSPDLCFTAGSVTYRLSPNANAVDYRVAIDNKAVRPDFRVRLVDRVEVADFALTDDTGALMGNACKTDGPVKTVGIVQSGAPADITIALSPQAGNHDFSIYVHSVRVSHADAAALFALVRQAPDTDRVLDGEHLAQVRPGPLTSSNVR